MELKSISVSELNKYIKDKFVSDELLTNVLIRGEISNFKNHYTGHLYFTLKDESSLIKCVMFKTYTSNLKFAPKDGAKVIIFGSVSVFERDGTYQVYCKGMQQEGVGDLHARYEELKQKLEKEGLFDKNNKKVIPFMPKTVGILTSQTGSVIKDIINVSTRRFPNVQLKLYPVPVQGTGAAEKIALAINDMNNNNLADVLIIARGGGSLEDLWPFNEEVVARAIFASNIPVISAVGHETDFTIADFVSDLRAPTPSAAAELAVPDITQLKWKLSNYDQRIKVTLIKKVEYMRLKYQKCMSSMVFRQPLAKIHDLNFAVDIHIKNLINCISNSFKDKRNKTSEKVAKLDTLSPLKTLCRGYSIVLNEKNEILKSKNDLKVNDKIKIRLVDGEIGAVIL